jgi:hypothetical protein
MNSYDHRLSKPVFKVKQKLKVKKIHYFFYFQFVEKIFSLLTETIYPKSKILWQKVLITVTLN